MSFAHSAYSTMGMSHAREVLKTKMMPKHFTDRQQAAAGPSRGGSAGKRAKTSAHTSNVNLQAESDDHDSEYDEDLEDEAAREEEQHEEKDRGPKSWLCPNGCGKTLTVGVGKVYMPTIRFKKDGTPYPTQDSWWLCYSCKKSLGFLEDKAAALAWKATAEDWESPLDEDYIKSAVKTARKEKLQTAKDNDQLEIEVTFRRNTKEQPKMKIHVTKALTVLDVKKKMALKYQLPYPEEMGDSQSRMLRLQANRGNSWQIVDDAEYIHTLIDGDEDHGAATEWQLELKRMKLDKESFINMLLNERNGIARLADPTNGLFRNVKFKGKGHERSDLRLLMTKYEEWCRNLCPVLSFDDCVEKIESVGNTTRIQSVLETLRAEESKKYTPTDEMEVEESAARNLSEELDDELPDHPDTSAKTTGTDAVGAGSEMPQSAADEMEEDEDTLMPDDMEEEELDAGFEYAGMEDDEDMDGHTPSVAAQPSVGKAPAPPSSTAAPAMKELSEEQKERIQRNKQAALLRLKERETAKALQAATSKDANEPATPAPGSSPAPSAGASRRASRAGSPRRSSSRAPASVVVRYMTPSMERLAATKAKNASASPSSAPPIASSEAVQNTASSGPALAQGAVADNFSRSDESQRRPMPGEVIEVAKGDTGKGGDEDVLMHASAEDSCQHGQDQYGANIQACGTDASSDKSAAPAAATVAKDQSPYNPVPTTVSKSPGVQSPMSPTALAPPGNDDESLECAEAPAFAPAEGTLEGTLVYEVEAPVADTLEAGGTLLYEAESERTMDVARDEDDLGLVEDIV